MLETSKERVWVGVGMELQNPVKDMKTVADYELKRKLEIFKAQCFNNSAVLHTTTPHASAEDIFNFAQTLYDEGLRREWYKIK